MPTVTGVSGSVAHGNTLTITGSGFGTKATAAPFMWDDMMGTVNSQAAVLARGWDATWPSSAPTGSSNLQYRTAGTPAAAHSHVTQYMRGIHEDSGSYLTGQDVIPSKQFTFSDNLAIYVSWYNAVGANWTNVGSMSPQDGNFKEFAYSNGTTVYDGTFWYFSIYNGALPPEPEPPGTGLGQGIDTYSWVLASAADFYSGTLYWGADGDAINPIGVWRKYELKLHTGDSGFIRLLQNNSGPFINYSGYFDRASGTTRSLGVGGFARSCNSLNNIRYFNDIYIDTNSGSVDVPRVILGNANTYSASTIVEPQIPSAWSTTSITVTANLGQHPDTGTAWLYVIASDGSVNASGFPVTLGASSTSSTIMLFLS